jgi:hypothetical protein
VEHGEHHVERERTATASHNKDQHRREQTSSRIKANRNPSCSELELVLAIVECGMSLAEHGRYLLITTSLLGKQKHAIVPVCTGTHILIGPIFGKAMVGE